MIHLASASEERKQSGSSGIELFNRRKRKEAKRGFFRKAPGERTEKLSFAERTNLPYRADCVGKANLFLPTS